MAQRPQLRDVAREAGVSPATVDRVLNGRDGVKARTKERVLEAASKLGYLPVIDTASYSTSKPVELTFLLPSGTNSFIHMLQSHIENQAASRPELRVTVEIIEGFNPQWLASRLLELKGITGGVGLVAQDHPLVREAMRTLHLAGVPVVTIASDVQNVPRTAYVGIDNRQAGRLAGHLLGRILVPGRSAKVGLFGGSLSYRGHEEREMGFRHIMREEFPTIQILELCETHDDRARAEVETMGLLQKHPDIAAIYNLGGATKGIATALKNLGCAGDIALIGHDLTEANKLLLLDGTIDAIIDQNPRVEAREALNILAHAVKGLNYAFVAPRIQVIFRENIPVD
jgi:LacI family transcriptional regulator